MIDEKVLIERLEKLENKCRYIFFKEREQNGRTFASEYADGKRFGITEIIKIVKKLAEEHNNGWISVEDRLPEDNHCPVLACTRNDVMYTAVYDAVDDKWYDDNFEREIFITDWQPLPQTPSRGE